MGLFSWKTSDTDRSIACEGSNRSTFEVFLLQPEHLGGKSKVVRETNYQGYGVFQDIDAYAWLGRVNAPEKCKVKDPFDTEPDAINADRLVGIYLKPEDIKFPIKFAESLVDYESLEASPDCEYQGYFYDDCLECGDEKTYMDSLCETCWDEREAETCVQCDEHMGWGGVNDEGLCEDCAHTCNDCGQVDESINGQCGDCWEQETYG